MPLEIDYYDLSIHKLMLQDRVRCEAFRMALAKTITPGCTVLDLGAGSGILSLFAAQAGAGVVYAIERTHTAELAKRIISENGYEDRIRVIRDDIENVELPEKVDIIVSEWLGGYGVDENLLPIVILARDRWLKTEGKIIPEQVSAWIAPAYDDLLQQDIDFWDQKQYGFDLGAIGEDTAQQMLHSRHHVKREHILSSPQIMWDINAKTCSADEAESGFDKMMQFVVQRNGQFNCLATWFESRLTQGISLANEPSDQYTHWGRYVFPAGAKIPVKEKMEIGVRFAVETQGKGRTKAIWGVEMGDYRFSSDYITVLRE